MSRWAYTRSSKSFALYLFWGLGGAIFISDNVAQINTVSGRSMEPSLSPLDNTTGRKDTVLWSKWEVQSKIQRGDVVLFSTPQKPDVIATKRVIATPGDTVILDPRRRPTRRVSGADVPESLGWDMYKRRAVVPEGHVWVEGDNWRESKDSNWYGPISKSLILGRASAVVWPYYRAGAQPWNDFKSKTKVIKGAVERVDELEFCESLGPV
ncbi:hypothetical protein B0A50_08755 [Salinomyces thailandicus]|uniref:Mitochondrial inner membrane protease subunit n=1 Tax=Salinomyces thailandicus TaxID=706561 RepID=A0A4U0TIY0_9PEZI|nr:hypothetical protein B0A50_08755 [Salinomyces thailandica]